MPIDAKWSIRMRFRCNLCGDFPQGFEFEDHAGVCPKCGASGSPHVAALIDVHFIVMDRKGPIVGSLGRQLIACQPQRSYLCRHPNEPFAASDEAAAVTCPRCRSTPAWRERARLIEQLLPALEPAATVTVDLATKKG